MKRVLFLIVMIFSFSAFSYGYRDVSFAAVECAEVGKKDLLSRVDELKKELNQLGAELDELNDDFKRAAKEYSAKESQCIVINTYGSLEERKQCEEEMQSILREQKNINLNRADVLAEFEFKLAMLNDLLDRLAACLG